MSGTGGGNGNRAFAGGKTRRYNGTHRAEIETEALKMVCHAGDKHGDFRRAAAFRDTVGSATNDAPIILGDAGINCFGGGKDRALKRPLAKLPVTPFRVRGNHE
jgi:hypothetical protein